MIPTIACSTPSIGSVALGSRAKLRNVFPGSFNALAYYATFDGTDDYVALSTAGYTDSTVVTYSVWSKSSTATNMYLLDSGNDQRILMLRYISGSNSFAYYTGAYSSFGADYDDGEWHHFAVSVNGTSITGYVDGVSKGSASVTQAEPSGNTGTTIGSRYSADSGFFNGQMADFRIYDSALSASEVKWLATNGMQGTAAPSGDLVLHYRFNDGSGTTVTDSSASGNDGTASGITQATFWNPYTGA